MTPRELTEGVAVRRLDAIDQLLGVAAELPPLTGADLDRDITTRLVVERILTQVIDLATDINAHISAAQGLVPRTDAAATFDTMVKLGVLPGELAAELKPSVGLRNILIHQYLDVNLDIVAAAVPLAVRGFGEYRRQVARWLVRQRA